MLDHVPDRVDSTCRHCGAMVRWAATTKGNRMPLQPYPEQGGNCLVVSTRPLLVRVLKGGERPPPGSTTYRPHWADCTHRSKPAKASPARPKAQQMQLALADEEA